MTAWSDEDANTTLRLAHVPAANDADDTRETLAAQSPASRRVADCILWQDTPDHYPGHLLHDVKRWFAGHIAREGVGATYDFAAVAVGAYLLGRLDKAMEEDAPPDAGARSLAFGLTWAGGFVTCLALALIGLWLSR